MTRALLASLAALAAVIFTVTAQDKEKPKDDKPVARKEDTLAEQIKRYEKNHHRRVSGAKLTISKAELTL